MLDFRLCGVIYCSITSLDAETGDKQDEWVDNKVLINDRMGRSSMGRTEWPNYEILEINFANGSPSLHATGHH